MTLSQASTDRVFRGDLRDRRDGALSSPKPRAIDLGLISDWLGQVTVHPISPVIRDQTIALRRERLLKLPDAIIAATAIALGVPLVNGDKRFLKAADRLDVRLLKLSR